MTPFLFGGNMAKTGKKYDLVFLTDPITQTKGYISPSDLVVYVGTVITDEKGNKKVGTATPKTLGVFLSEKDAEIDKLRKEVSELRINNKNNIKKILTILEVLVGQTELNSLDLNEILDNLEDK